MASTEEVVQLPKTADVVVIGSGIGGLVCSTYLAKAGLKVVLTEKHHTVGGFCSSFKRGPYYFDAGAHYLGSCRQDGQIGRVMRELNMTNDVNFIRCDPSELVVSKNRQVLIYGDLHRTSDQLVAAFPEESHGISRFLSYITKTDPLKLFVDLSRITFRQLLDEYFSGWEIKSVLSTLLGNIGLPSSQASALTAVFLFREFILDGGYYPRGGMQAFPDAFLKKFKEFGGIVLLLSPVQKIELHQDGSVSAVSIRYRGKEDLRIETQITVVNCDPYQLYGKLLAGWEGAQTHLSGIESRMSTVSAFMVHLGIKGNLEKLLEHHCNIWSYRKGDIDDYYLGVMHGVVDFGRDSFLFASIPSLHDRALLQPGYHSIQAIIAAPYFERDQWQKIRECLADDIIGRLEEFIPELRSMIEITQIATPATLVKYTWSHHGAMYGWASTPSQVGRNRIPEVTAIPGLYMVGQWTGLPSGHSGIPTVVSSGRATARLVLRHSRHRKTKAHSLQN